MTIGDETMETNAEIRRKENKLNDILYELSKIVNSANKIDGLVTKDDKGDPYKRDDDGLIILPQHYEDPDTIDNRTVARFTVLVEAHPDSTEEQKQELKKLIGKNK